MLTTTRAWDIGIVVVTTLVIVVCLVIMFPRAQVIAAARDETLTFVALSGAIAVAAMYGSIWGIKRPLPARKFQGLWPWAWGLCVGVTVAVFGMASTDLSLWFLVLFSLLTAMFLGACREQSVDGRQHG